MPRPGACSRNRTDDFLNCRRQLSSSHASSRGSAGDKGARKASSRSLGRLGSKGKSRRGGYNPLPTGADDDDDFDDFDDAITSERAALVGRSPADGSSARHSSGQLRDTRVDVEPLAPQWVDRVQDARFQMEALRSKMDALAEMHDDHLNRPELEETAQQHTIEIATQEITDGMRTCQRCIAQIRPQNTMTNAKETQMIKNAQSALARQLQSLSSALRTAQNVYLENVSSRAVRLGSNVPLSDSIFDPRADQINKNRSTGFNETQTQRMADQSELIGTRDKEVTEIVRSIEQLQSIFRDLGQLIVDQGTVLDRIDYNIEMTSQSVTIAHSELTKAEKYQKSGLKKKIILILSALIAILLLAILFRKL